MLLKRIYFLLIFTCSFAYLGKSFVPYFASIGFTHTNVRENPAFNSIVKITYIQRNEPIKVIASFYNWKKIQDVDGHTGWIISNAISTKRYVIVVSKNHKELYKDLNSGKIQALVSKNVVCKLVYCNNNWCKIKVQGYEGWIEKAALWGV